MEKRLLFAINVLQSTCSGVWGTKVSTVWGFLSSLLMPLLTAKLRSWWIPPSSERPFGEHCSNLHNLRVKFNPPRSWVHTLGPPLGERVTCFGHRGEVGAVREQLSVFLEVCEGHLGAWSHVTFSGRAWMAAELSSQGCSTFCRLYLRCIKKVSSEHHFKK